MHDRTIRWESRSVLGLLALVGLGASLMTGCGSGQGGWSFPEAETWHRYSLRARRPGVASAPVLDAQGGARTGPQAEPDVDPIARGLFVRNCATCHGEDGSGEGPSVLDRPARNFKHGGFSFGNTADAIFNTISYGIPGTPMPAFGQALGEQECRQLAGFVRTLGPPVEEVDEADTIMVVTEQSGPLIVRGILPPIVEGAPIRPRGLLVGLPGGDGPGLTFEYRIDDVRLLGVRQGDFVARTDWNDRGGTPLRPLGGLIWTDSGGDPPETFARELHPAGQLPTEGNGGGTETLRARLQRSEVVGRRCSVTYSLDSERTGSNIEIRELAYPTATTFGSGFARELAITRITPGFPPRGAASSLTGRDADEVAWLRVSVGAPKAADLVDSFGSGNHDERCWHVYLRADGVIECVGVRLVNYFGPRLPVLLASDGRLDVLFVPEATAGPGSKLEDTVEVLRVFGATWSQGLRRELADSR